MLLIVLVTGGLWSNSLEEEIKIFPIFSSLVSWFRKQ
jgi:hypothetical protein